MFQNWDTSEESIRSSRLEKDISAFMNNNNLKRTGICIWAFGNFSLKDCKDIMEILDLKRNVSFVFKFHWMIRENFHIMRLLYVKMYNRFL